VQDLLEAHLPEVVVDPVELGFVDRCVELVGELLGRRAVVAEGLFDHHAPVRGQARVGQALDDRAEQERRDLEIEHGALRPTDCIADPLVGGGVGEIALDVGQALGEAVEHLRVERLACALNRVAGPFAEPVDGPVVHRHSDDRAVEQPAPLEPVERAEGHDLRQIAGDPEDHKDVGRPVEVALGGSAGRLCRCRRVRHRVSPLQARGRVMCVPSRRAPLSRDRARRSRP
jgi:hypothetical protein